MADVLGHVAMGLVWALPAWFLWTRRVAVSFVSVVLLAVMVPDVDLYLPGAPHHGITHTLVFVAGVAVVGGAVIAVLGRQLLGRLWGREGGPVDRTSAFAFAAVALGLGGASHVFADLLSAGTAGNPPVEPFWPLFAKPFSVDVFRYSAFLWNGGLLIVALAGHLALYVLEVSPLVHRYRVLEE